MLEIFINKGYLIRNIKYITILIYDFDHVYIICG